MGGIRIHSISREFAKFRSFVDSRSFESLCNIGPDMPTTLAHTLTIPWSPYLSLALALLMGLQAWVATTSLPFLPIVPSCIPVILCGELVDPRYNLRDLGVLRFPDVFIEVTVPPR